MNLKKNSWNTELLKYLILKVEKVNHKAQKGVFNYIDIGAINSELKKVEKIQKINWNNASSRARQVVAFGDTLFSTVRVNLERIAYIDFQKENLIATTGFCVIRPNEKVLPKFLFYSLIERKFINKLVQLQKGTAYPAVTNKEVLAQEVLLPPLHEQQQIVSLFQSIDNSIEQTEAQEENLRQLKSKIVSDLLSPQPIFGNLLDNATLSHETLGSLAQEIRKSCKTPLENGIEYFVGLEHITKGEFELNGKGLVANGTTFTKTFELGDVLFGKRRAYLKKAAVADFKGICSGDILVLRANEQKILKELFPFYISGNAVFDFAVSNSAGSLSPRAKWKDLSKFEIKIPDLKIQEKILSILQQIETTKKLCKAQTQTLKQLKQKLLDEILG